MNFNDIISSNIFIFTLSIFVLFIILLVLIIIVMVKQKKLNKKYNQFMSGEKGQNLESLILSRFKDIDGLKVQTKETYAKIGKIEENLLLTYQKIGIVKYDAFKEMGGKLSFVLALLDKNNNGILLNSVHSSREGCYMYLKEIIKGESFLELSEDEKAALDQAVKSSNFME